MLRIVTGSFYGLEPALVDEVWRLKAADPLVPLAIVVPSQPLRSWLRERLVLGHGLSLLNVHFLTFHQLALRLDDERQAGAPEGHGRLTVASDLFFERLLKEIGRRGLPGAEALRLESLPPGGWAALWATLRDLKDAGVDPATALAAVAEGQFGVEDAPKLRGLFTLLAALDAGARALGVGTADDLAAAVIPAVPASRFLAGLGRVLYYGFYDLTQVQLSLLEAVVRAAPATVYFPLGEGPAYEFARRFFERHLRALASLAERTAPADGAAPLSDPHDRPAVQVMNAVGSEDELALVCKEILVLVESRGFAFDEIGVVARTLTPYAEGLPRLLAQHRIPFVTTATRPLIAEPAAKVLVQLARLPLTGFYRAPVLDVLTSPLHRSRTLGGNRPAAAPRPDLWRRAVEVLGITRGEAEWRRLAQAGSLRLHGSGDQEEDAPADEEALPAAGVPAAQLDLLWRLVAELMADCRALPSEGTVGELTEAFLSLAAKHLSVPGFSEAGEDGLDGTNERGPAARPASVGAALRALFEELRGLDRLPGTLTWEEWVGLFTRALERAAVPLGSDRHRGVQILDAMAARGLSFRALFLLGLNDQVFPRSIREDAFLRDRYRRVLAETLGYKLDEKLAGYDEERLLFALLTGSARERLYLLYQRADAEGRPLAPSPYLVGSEGLPPERKPVPDVILPRRLTERFTHPLWAPTLLTAEELGLWLVLSRCDPGPVLAAFGREAALFRNGWEALGALEGREREPGPYDGITGPLDHVRERVVQRGVAPTPLEQYARCPFQYFAAQVLCLDPVRREPVEALPAQALGELCHRALRCCYERLVAAGWPDQGLAPERLRTEVAAAVDAAAAAYAAQQGTGYPLLWELARETVAALVQAAVAADAADYRATGYRPLGFEVEAAGRLEGVGLENGGALRLRGRWDRVDRRAEPPALRVVDYKYKHGKQMKSQDRNLLTAAVRGYRLQPPLYALMAPKDCPETDPARLEEVVFLFLAPHWTQPVARSRFETANWEGATGARLRATLRTLLEGITGGQFVIVPDGYCDQCDYTAACRRFHGPTAWRAVRAEVARRIRGLRKQRVEHQGDGCAE
ncbi:PD-(D/E)XK nuclease family protein [Nitrospira sp. Kam-Ns4a]